MNDDLYSAFQPATWSLAVVDAPPLETARTIASQDARAAGKEPATVTCTTINAALPLLEPLGPCDKLLVAGTSSGSACLFGNGFILTVVAYAAWTCVETLGTTAVSIIREPRTISRDRRSGVWGAREITVRDPTTPFGQKERFSVRVINDCGRWEFYRAGEVLWFEDQETYASCSGQDRFSDRMLVRYLDAMGMPIYDSRWYSQELFMVPMVGMSGTRGFTYDEAATHLRIPQMSGRID